MILRTEMVPMMTSAYFDMSMDQLVLRFHVQGEGPESVRISPSSSLHILNQFIFLNRI